MSVMKVDRFADNILDYLATKEQVIISKSIKWHIIIMAVTEKEKELIAIGISVVAGCKPCTSHHLKAAKNVGASDTEIEEAATTAILVRERATAVMKQFCLSRLGRPREIRGKTDQTTIARKTNRITELISIGAAYAVNCTTSIRKHLDAAKSLGIGQEDVIEIIKLSTFIKGRGAYHVEKYQPPERDKRIFLFLDLRNSTAIAEQLGHIVYSRFIRSCYHDLSDIVINYQAQIYQYVGDEVVLSWDIESGISGNNCLALFFAFANKLEEKRADYEKQFGVAPSFRGGMDVGLVVKAEVGDIKKETAYHGDVLNTAARLQELCKTYGQKLLISERLNNIVTPNISFSTRLLDDVVLRGKTEKVGVYTIEWKDMH